LPRRPISPQKRCEIIRLWLVEHLTYEEIRERTGVSMGIISETVSEFKKKAREMSLEEAARIFGVKDEVSALLDLSKDLKEAGITVSEAKRGACLLAKLDEMNVKIDDVESWINLCREISQPNFPANEFVEAAIKLSKLERETGLDYKHLISEYEWKLGKLKQAQVTIETLKEEINALEKEVKGLEEKRSLKDKLEKRIIEARSELNAYETSIKELESRKKTLEEDLRHSIAKGKETLGFLNAKIEELSKNVKALEEEQKRLNEELAPKRTELYELNKKVYEAKLQHESLLKKYEELKASMEELERSRSKYVEEIAKYEMEYGIYMEMLEKVAAKLNGRELKVKELRDIVIETLQDEASKMANSILAQWIEEGYIVPVGEFPVNVKCPHCSTTFPLQITKEFMARLVRGYGILKIPQLGPLPSIEIPRPPSPGSTTIKCPSCDWLIQITYEQVIEELSKAVKRKQRAN